MRGYPPVPCGCRGFIAGGPLLEGAGGGKGVELNGEEADSALLLRREGGATLKAFGDEGTDCIRGCVAVVGDMA